MSELVFSSADALAEAVSRRTEEAAREAIATRGRFTCALTGGSAARLVYPALARARIDWAKVCFFYGDERCVPMDHPDSNHRQASAALGRTGARFFPIDGSRPPEVAAAEYEERLMPLDVVHLGVGPDGHVCSLFPGHALSAESGRRAMAIFDAPKPPPRRVTLTLPALLEARSLWFLVMGKEKQEAVRAALRSPQSSLPAALVHRAAAQSVWFLDENAAGLLTA